MQQYVEYSILQKFITYIGYSHSYFCLVLVTMDFELILSTLIFRILRICYRDFHKHCSINLASTLGKLNFDCFCKRAGKYYLLNLSFFSSFNYFLIVFKQYCRLLRIAYIILIDVVLGKKHCFILKTLKNIRKKNIWDFFS